MYTHSGPLRSDPLQIEARTTVTALTGLRLHLRLALIVGNDDLSVTSSNDAHDLSVLHSDTTRRVTLQQQTATGTAPAQVTPLRVGQ